MKRWVPCELHTHTQASDGKFTLEELACNAKSLGLEAFAVTDHNTLHTDAEIKDISEKVGIEIISGLEWTTFYGHLVTLGLKEYADWRCVGANEIHRGLDDIHGKQGIAGIAHPFRVGGPLGTGCYWEFNVEDWNDIDYIEVWSGLTPYMNPNNKQAYELWNNLINEGYKITALCGRDWHESYHGNELPAVSYLGIDVDDNRSFQDKALEAIKSGCVSVTTGPLITLTTQCNSTGIERGIGEELIIDEASYITGVVNLDWNTRKGLWNLGEDDLKLRLISNKGILYETCLDLYENKIEVNMPSYELMWLSAELINKDNIVAFTNPIYFKSIKGK